MNKPLHMPSGTDEWPRALKWRRLDAICEGVFDCPHTTPRIAESGPFVVRSQDIRKRVFDWRNAGRVSISTYEERISRAKPRYGDILYSREGTYFGIAAEVPKNMQLCLGQRMVLIRPCVTFADHRFLLYWLNSPIMGAHLAGFRDGSVAERLNMATIRALPVPLPPLPEQREIAATLGALDDKIELNRKTAAALEEMARALYRSWFVDFDPVYAKAEGRAPAHMDVQTAALFPDRFTENGLPEGWRLGTLGGICKQVKRTLKPMDEPHSLFWHFSLPAYDAGAVPLLEDGASIRSAKTFSPNDAVLFSRLNPNISRIWWVRSDNSVATPVASTEFFVAQALRIDDTAWLYSLLSSAEFVEQAQSRVTGTSNSHQRIPPQSLTDIEVITATDETIEAFAKIAGPFFEHIHSIRAENQTLATLRDTLLPRLMSGELRVPAARKLVEEAL